MILLVFAAVAGRGDETGERVYAETLRMHDSPFAPDTHAPAEEKKTATPSIGRKGYAPASSLSPVRPDALPLMPLPEPPDPVREKEERKQENWITPASTATDKKEEPEESGWGWLADEATRKLQEKEQKENADAEDEDEDEYQAETRREDREDSRDSGYFINNDYFNNAGMFDTSSQFDVKERDEKNTQAGGDNMMKPAVEDQKLASAAEERKVEDPTSPDREDRAAVSGFASAPEGIGMPSRDSGATTPRYSLNADVDLPRESIPAVSRSPGSFAPPSEPVSIRISVPGAGDSAGFGRMAAPSSFQEPAGIPRSAGFSAMESPLARPSLMQPQSIAPSAAAGMPASGSLPAPSAAGSAIQTLYDSREESGMRLLPR